jgi:hypothetical protein
MADHIARPEHAVGKELLGWIAEALESRKLAQGSALVRPSKALEHEVLKRAAERIRDGAQRGSDIAINDDAAPSPAATEGRKDG